MIEAILLALAQVPSAQPPAPPQRSAWCRGVHMPNGSVGVNLLWTTIRGPDARLSEIGERMRALGAGIHIEGPGEIRATYKDDLDARAIGALLNAIDAGEFGPLTTQDFAMSLDTLPEDRCLRFRG